MAHQPISPEALVLEKMLAHLSTVQSHVKDVAKHAKDDRDFNENRDLIQNLSAVAWWQAELVKSDLSHSWHSIERARQGR